MMFWVKIVLTFLLTVGVAELSKYNARLGGILNALPLQSLIIITWLYVDTRDLNKIMDLSRGMLWVLPVTFLFFVLLAVFVKTWGTLWPALASATALSALGYGAIHVGRKFI